MDVYVSYWVTLVVCMSTLSLEVAGSIYSLCPVAFWPASHSGGEHYSTQRHAFMTCALQARRPPDNVVTLDNYASVILVAPICQFLEWLRNSVPCNSSVTSANGVRFRSTQIGRAHGKLPT